MFHAKARKSYVPAKIINENGVEVYHAKPQIELFIFNFFAFDFAFLRGSDNNAINQVAYREFNFLRKMLLPQLK